MAIAEPLEREHSAIVTLLRDARRVWCSNWSASVIWLALVACVGATLTLWLRTKPPVDAWQQTAATSPMHGSKHPPEPMALPSVTRGPFSDRVAVPEPPGSRAVTAVPRPSKKQGVGGKVAITQLPKPPSGKQPSHTQPEPAISEIASVMPNDFDKLVGPKPKPPREFTPAGSVPEKLPDPVEKERIQPPSPEEQKAITIGFNEEFGLAGAGRPPRSSPEQTPCFK